MSTIGFGWESPSFYKDWMGVTSDEEDIPQLDEATIDISSPNKVSAQSMIGFFDALLDEKWINTFKRNYAAVK